MKILVVNSDKQKSPAVLQAGGRVVKLPGIKGPGGAG